MTQEQIQTEIERLQQQQQEIDGKIVKAGQFIKALEADFHALRGAILAWQDMSRKISAETEATGEQAQ